MRHFNNLKFMAITLLVAMLSLSFTACSDDDDVNASEITDYYMTCKVSGGGFSPNELESLEAAINAELTTYCYWEELDLNRALYYFNDEIEDWQEQYEYGAYDVRGTLTITFYLKNDDGKIVKTTNLYITKDESYIE